MKTEIDVRDGEACLGEKVLSGNLNDLTKHLINKNFTLDDSIIGRVTKDESWKSTEKSTEIVPILYFTGPHGLQSFVLTKRTEDKEYAIFKYRWTP